MLWRGLWGCLCLLGMRRGLMPWRLGREEDLAGVRMRTGKRRGKEEGREDVTRQEGERGGGTMVIGGKGGGTGVGVGKEGLRDQGGMRGMPGTMTDRGVMRGRTGGQGEKEEGAGVGVVRGMTERRGEGEGMTVIVTSDRGAEKDDCIGGQIEIEAMGETGHNRETGRTAIRGLQDQINEQDDSNRGS